MAIKGKKKHYNVQFWIVDSPDPNERSSNPANEIREYEDKHVWNCRNMVNMVQNITDFKLVQIYLPPRSKEKQFFGHVEDLLRATTEDDLVVVYFHGNSGDEGEEYTWVFSESAPKRGINAYEFIETLAQSKAESMIIVDSYMPTRFPEKWQRESGITEIITCGGRFQDVKGHVKDRKGKTFTDAILSALKEYADQGVEPITLPQLIRRNKDLPFSPDRIDIGGKTGTGASRLFITPKRTGPAGKIEICGDVREKPEKSETETEAEDEQAEIEDEGYVEETPGPHQKDADAGGCGGGDGRAGMATNSDSNDQSLFVPQG